MALLTRHFFRRVLDNDLLSPGDDLHAPIAGILAAVLSTVGGAAAIFYLKYTRRPPITLETKLAMAVDDKALLLGAGMIVMALATLLVWDALSLDRRDVAVIGPLPVRARTLLVSKIASVAGLAAALAAALSLPPALLFPTVLLLDCPVSLAYALRSMGAQAVAGLLGCLFVFLALTSLRNLVSLALPPSLARGTLAALQGLLVPVLFAVLLMLPMLAMMTRPAIEAGSPTVLAWPPLWFLGINDVLIGRDAAVLGALARAGGLGLGAAGLVASASYLLAFRRGLARFDDRAADRFARAGGLVAAFDRAAGVLVRDPLSRASAAFTALTLVRSPRHRLYLVGYLGAGVALACASIPAGGGGVRIESFALGPIALGIQFNLVFFLLVGVRMAAGDPAELRAAWLFRVLASGALSRYLAGMRSAVLAFGVVPLLLLVAPAHVLLWGWYPAAVHFACGLAFAAALWAILFRGFDRLPFAAPARPGRARLSTRLLFYVMAWWTGIYVPAALEWALLPRAALAPMWSALAAACLASLVVPQRRRPRPDRLPDFDAPGGEIQVLGLDAW